MSDLRLFTNPEGGNCWTLTPYEKLHKGDVFQLMDAKGHFVPNEEGGRHFVATDDPFMSVNDGKWFVYGRPAWPIEIEIAERGPLGVKIQ